MSQDKLEALENELNKQCTEPLTLEECCEGNLVVLVNDDEDDVSYHRVRIMASKDAKVVVV